MAPSGVPFLCNLYAQPAEFGEDLVIIRFIHGGAVLAEEGDVEALAGGVGRGGADAIIRGDARYLNRLDALGLEPCGQGLPGRAAALKTRVRGGVLPLVEALIDERFIEIRMQRRARGLRHAMNGPGVHEIRLLGEVALRVDVPILRGHLRRVPPGGLQPADLRGYLMAARGSQAASRAEIILHVNDYQSCPHAPQV